MSDSINVVLASKASASSPPLMIGPKVVIAVACCLAPVCFASAIPIMYQTYTDIPGPNDPFVARFHLPMLSDVGRQDPTRIIFTAGMCLLAAVYAPIIVMMRQFVLVRINTMSGEALASHSASRLARYNDWATGMGLASIFLLACTGLVPNTVHLMMHNTAAALHFITSGIWQLLTVLVLHRTAHSPDPRTHAANRSGITFKLTAALLNLLCGTMVVALFFLFKTMGAHDDHTPSTALDNSAGLQWLRWVIWPLFEYVVVLMENMFTWSLFSDLKHWEFALTLVPVSAKPRVITFNGNRQHLE